MDLRELRDQPFDLLRVMEDQLRRAEGGGSVETWTGLRFSLAEKTFVAPRWEIGEILPPTSYTRIPNARPWLLGLANVRGNLEAVIDTRRLLFGQTTVITENTRMLVLESEEVPAAFLVDTVGGFISFGAQEQRHDSVQSDCDAESQPYLLGAFVREGSVFPVFSLAKLAFSTDFQQAAA